MTTLDELISFLDYMRDEYGDLPVVVVDDNGQVYEHFRVECATTVFTVRLITT